MNTPGGEDPLTRSELKSFGACLENTSAFVRIGHFVLPQRSFAPLQARHNSADGRSMTSFVLHPGLLPTIPSGLYQELEEIKQSS